MTTWLGLRYLVHLIKKSIHEEQELWKVSQWIIYMQKVEFFMVLCANIFFTVSIYIKLNLRFIICSFSVAVLFDVLL